MPINQAKKLVLIIVLYPFVAHTSVVDASQALQSKSLTKRKQHKESVYCSVLPCWSHMPCFQHPEHNAQGTWHDAQRRLSQQILYIIGLYALPEHTHTVGRLIPGPFLNEAGIFIDKQLIKLGRHIVTDKSSLIKTIESSEGTIARILLTPANKQLFRTRGAGTAGKRVDESDYVPYYKSPFDKSVAIKVVDSESGICSSTIHLIPEADSSILQQASFIAGDSKIIDEKKKVLLAGRAKYAT